VAKAKDVVSFVGWWGLLLALCGGMTVLFGYPALGMLRDGRRARESASWPRVRGHVLSSSCERAPGVRQTRTPDLRVHYRYVVEGKAYEGHRATFATHLGALTCEELAADYPAGAEADVHVAPADPSLSVLLPGEGPSLVMTGLASLVAVAFAALTLFLTGIGGRMALRMAKGAPTPPRRRRRRR